MFYRIQGKVDRNGPQERQEPEWPHGPGSKHADLRDHALLCLVTPALSVLVSLNLNETREKKSVQAYARCLLLVKLPWSMRKSDTKTMLARAHSL